MSRWLLCMTFLYVVRCELDVVVRGKLQRVVLGDITSGKQKEYCSIAESDLVTKVTILANVIGSHCLTGVEVEFGISPSRHLMIELPATKHAVADRVISVNGMPLLFQDPSHPDADKVATQLDAMVDMVRGNRAALASRAAYTQSLPSLRRRLSTNMGVLIVHTSLANELVDDWCDEACALEQIWGEGAAATAIQQSTYNAITFDNAHPTIATIRLSTTTSHYSDCNVAALATDALVHLSDNSFDTSPFSLFQFYIPVGMDCTWTYLSQGSSYSWVRMKGSFIATQAFGANLGLPLADIDYNNDGEVDIPSSDRTSLMGGPLLEATPVRVMDAVGRIQNDYITSDGIASFLCTSGTCTSTFSVHDLQADPLSVQAAGGVSAIKAPRDANSDYYLSYRAGTGLDDDLSTEYRDSVLIQVWNGADSTRLIAPLRPGETYPARTVGADSANRTLFITVDSVSAGVALVTLELRNDVHCEEVWVDMLDAYSDGWSGNYLRFQSPTHHLKVVTMPVLPTYRASICLPPGWYEAYCCGGSYGEETFWSLTGGSIRANEPMTGGGINDCDAVQRDDERRFRVGEIEEEEDCTEENANFALKLTTRGR